MLTIWIIPFPVMVFSDFPVLVNEKSNLQIRIGYFAFLPSLDISGNPTKKQGKPKLNPTWIFDFFSSVQEVEEFEERKNQEDEFEWRKGKSSFRLLSVSCGFTFRFINFFKSIMAKFAAMLVYSSKCTELNVSRFIIFLQHKQLRLRRPLAAI